MKEHPLKNYLYWGLTAVAVIGASIALVFMIINFKSIRAGWGMLVGILSPIIYGAVLAFLFNPIFNRTDRLCTRIFRPFIKSPRLLRAISRGIGTLVCLILLFVIVAGLLSMLLPEIHRSIRTVAGSTPANVENLYRWLSKALEDNKEIETQVLKLYQEAVTMLQGWLSNDLLPNMDKIISGVSEGIFNVLNLLKNLLIGIIVMVYLLNIKETLCGQIKKIFYGFLKTEHANNLVERFRFINRVFGGFIIGKLLDSLIIGILCFIGLSLMKMPYVLLISVIVGVTNIIPFFGPFIGAVPSAILIILYNPMQCLYFLIFILLLQQFDGNILGPKILGDSTGLGSFWVLFSILLFGGLFGFVGMIIAVPTFAIALAFLAEWTRGALAKKQLSVRTEDYIYLDYIDETSRQYVPVQRMEKEQYGGEDEGEKKRP